MSPPTKRATPPKAPPRTHRVYAFMPGGPNLERPHPSWTEELTWTDQEVADALTTEYAAIMCLTCGDNNDHCPHLRDLVAAPELRRFEFNDVQGFWFDRTRP